MLCPSAITEGVAEQGTHRDRDKESERQRETDSVRELSHRNFKDIDLLP